MNEAPELQEDPVGQRLVLWVVGDSTFEAWLWQQFGVLVEFRVQLSYGFVTPSLERRPLSRHHQHFNAAIALAPPSFILRDLVGAPDGNYPARSNSYQQRISRWCDHLLRRYKRGWVNFLEVYRPLADHWVIYENSEAPPKLLERGT